MGNVMIISAKGVRFYHPSAGSSVVTFSIPRKHNVFWGSGELTIEFPIDGQIQYFYHDWEDEKLCPVINCSLFSCWFYSKWWSSMWCMIAYKGAVAAYVIMALALVGLLICLIMRCFPCLVTFAFYRSLVSKLSDTVRRRKRSDMDEDDSSEDRVPLQPRSVRTRNRGARSLIAMTLVLPGVFATRSCSDVSVVGSLETVCSSGVGASMDCSLSMNKEISLERPGQTACFDFFTEDDIPVGTLQVSLIEVISYHVLSAPYYTFDWQVRAAHSYMEKRRPFVPSHDHGESRTNGSFPVLRCSSHISRRTLFWTRSSHHA